MWKASAFMGDPSNKFAKTDDAMDASHKSLCLIADVTSESDEWPELPTNEPWRAEMIRARKAAKMSQATLGDLVGSDQSEVSRVEKGKVGGSKLVIPICRALGLQLPEHYVDEFQREFNRVMQVVRSRRPESAEAALANLQTLAELIEQQEAAESAPASAPKDTKKKPGKLT